MPSEKNFYSGFSLKNESFLFDAYRSGRPFSLAGFSYGAILAFEEALSGNRRVDLLQLFSPAFFQDQSTGFKRLQLKSYRTWPEAYMATFLANCAKPSDFSLEPYAVSGTLQQLESLLQYTWTREKVEHLLGMGTHIEVHLGEADAIINAKAAAEFFKPLVTLYRYKGKGHILKGIS